MPSQVKIISVANTARLGLRMGRWGLFLTVLMLKVVFFLLFHLSLTPSKPTPCSQVRLLDCFRYFYFCFIYCQGKDRKSQPEAEPTSPFFLQEHVSQVIFLTHPQNCIHGFCLLLVVHANTGALFIWDAYFCYALRGLSKY